jgi:sulfate permease, SulP family
MVVGALIFALGIDLVKEAVWDTRHRVSRCVANIVDYIRALYNFLNYRTEFITIVSIMVCMTVWDFVIGVLFGIIVSCEYPRLLSKSLLTLWSQGFFFVVQNSQHRSIRVLHTGESVMSTVRRPGSQRAYIREVSKQTTILRLQGVISS